MEKEYYYKPGDLVIGRSGVRYEVIPEIHGCGECSFYSEEMIIPCGRDIARGDRNSKINCGVTRVIFKLYTGPLGRRFINLRDY